MSKHLLFLILLISFELNSFSQTCFEYRQQVYDYLNNNSSNLDDIEGVWKKVYKRTLYDEIGNIKWTQVVSDYEYAIYKSGNKYMECYLVGNMFYNNTSGINNEYIKTSIKGTYLFKTNCGAAGFAEANCKLSDEGVLTYNYRTPKNYSLGNFLFEVEMTKIYPSSESHNSFTPRSGTGFAISSNGIIVTNSHVINGSTSIKVKGIKGDFSKSYNAKILVEDRTNDIAIIFIDDISFSSLGTIPYIFSNKSSDVGCSVFCLGYPLRSTMGDEVKLTNGIISSKSGFQGDITNYQISAPVQPGNSGGPLFDYKGNLIGIISAKHIGTENVSYAIKVSYLLNLIEQIPIIYKRPELNSLIGKSLSDQVKRVKNFTYIIEAN